MPKQKIVVDKEKLQIAIDRAEEGGPLSGMTVLWQQVAVIYNALCPAAPITPSVAMLRFAEMGLICKTQPGKRGHAMSEELKAKMREARKGVKIVRRSRASKLAALDGAAENFARLREITPKRFQPLVDRVEKGSLTAAIKLLCVQCVGYEAKSVWECKGLSCPIYLHRPYQKSDDSENDKGEEASDSAQEA